MNKTPQPHVRQALELHLLDLQRLTNSAEAFCLGVIFAWSAGRLRGHGFTLEMLSAEMARLSKSSADDV